MTKNHIGEKWKTVDFDFEYTNHSRLEISDFGRIKTFNKISKGNIIGGSMINGYRIIRMKFFKPRDAETDKKLAYLQKQVVKLANKIKQMKMKEESKKDINEAVALLDALKAKLSNKFAEATKKRTIHYHSLIHRLVAEYFLKKPTKGQTIVAHLDHEKLNNRSSNLKWMTPKENSEHQQKSPYVIKDKLERSGKRKADSKTAKLTVTKVMLLKKLLNQGRPMKLLVKQFKVTETQIYRIKRGENWADIEAAI